MKSAAVFGVLSVAAFGISLYGLLASEGKPVRAQHVVVDRPLWGMNGDDIFNTNVGNVGIGTRTPVEKLEVAGNVQLSGAGNGVIFPDGTAQTTAVRGGGGGVPSGLMLVGESPVSPSGYSFAGILPNSGIWRARASMPTLRRDLSAASVGNKVYAIGGSNGVFLDTLEVYDTDTDEWISEGLNPMPTARDGLAAAVVGNKVYAIGGWNGTFRNNLEAYNTETGEWETLAPMQFPREHLAAVAVGNRIYAIGGGGRDAGKWLEVYDTEMGEWTTGTDMPTARTGLAAVALGNKIYAIGGSGSAGLAQRVEEYDIDTGEWRRKADMPTSRTLLAAAGVDAIGGDAPGGGALATVEEYDPVSNTWTTKPNMPTARISLAAALVGRRIFAIGGYNNSYLGTLEEYFGPLFLHRKN